DQTGALVAGARVTVESESGLRREVTTESDGTYVVPLLPPGTYRLEISLAGFKTYVLEGVVVRITETTVVNAGLEVGQLSEEITVTAESPLLQTETPTTGRVITGKRLTELPLATRNFTQLLALTPGTNVDLPDHTAPGLNTLDVSVNGLNRYNNSFQLNGVDTNAIGINNAFSYPVPAPDALEEFKVLTSLYDASYGRSAGGQINVVTKSGTNEFHGSLYEFLRNDKLNANDFFSNATGARRPKFIRNQFGFTLGGPIIKGRTHFFGSYQGSREVNGAARGQALSTLALPPLLTDDRTPAGISRASGVPEEEISPIALNLLNARLPDGSLVIPSPQVNRPGTNYSASVPFRFREDQFTVSVDHQLGINDKLSGKFFFTRNPERVGLNVFGGANVPGFGSRRKNQNRHLALSYQHIFGPTLTNEVRFGLHRLLADFHPNEPITAASVGISRFNTSIFPGIPAIGVLGSFQIGPGGFDQLKTNINTFTYADTLSWVKGRHNMRMGTEIRRIQENGDLPSFHRGSILFLDFASFVRGTIFLTIVGSGISDFAYRNTDFSAFFQDDFKVTPKLTLNLGVRYEFFGSASDIFGRLQTFDPAQYRTGGPPNGFVLAGNARGRFRVPGVPLVSDTLLDSEDPNNFAPRLGFAYRPSAGYRLVIRGGYGLFYDRLSNQPQFFAVGATPFGEFSVSIFPTLFGTATFADPFPDLGLPTDFPKVPVIPDAAQLAAGVTPISGFFMDRHMRTPYVQQWNLTLQYEVADNYLIEVGYVGTKGTKLIRQVKIAQAQLASPTNPINGITENTPANAALRSPFLGFSPDGLHQFQTSGNSTYHSFQASLTKRFSQGLQFLIAYTLGKSLDDRTTLTGLQGDATAFAPGDQTRLFLNKGRSDIDRRHRLVIHGTYDFPSFRSGRGPAGKFLSGWELAWIATLQSGRPIDIVDSNGASLFGVTTSRASFAPGATIESASRGGSVNRRLNRFFNTDAFVPAGFGFGNVGRNILTGPDQRNMDLSIIKRTPIYENHTLEFRAEFFNVFNTVNFANPGNDIASPATFGVITRTSASPRIIQFALKYSF
ncbi:MAG: hypothetical protein D6723_07885, partial [Acidobacteria bacterium]